jgi:hypothetical protein
VQLIEVIPQRLYADDNGKFGKGWPGADACFGWLKAPIGRYGRGPLSVGRRPALPMDAATLAESLPWLERIRAWVFRPRPPRRTAASTSSFPGTASMCCSSPARPRWNTSSAAHRLALEARKRGLAVGRVNSRRRLRLTQAFGCTS